MKGSALLSAGGQASERYLFRPDPELLELQAMEMDEGLRMFFDMHLAEAVAAQQLPYRSEPSAHLPLADALPLTESFLRGYRYTRSRANTASKPSYTA